MEKPGIKQKFYWAGISLFLLALMAFGFQNCGQMTPAFDPNKKSSSRTADQNQENENDGGTQINTEEEPEPPPPLEVFAVDSTNLEAGVDQDFMVVSLMLNRPDDEVVMIEWATEDRTAFAGVQYMAMTETTEVPAGESSVELRIPLIQAEFADMDFAIRILSLSKGSITNEVSTVTIPAARIAEVTGLALAIAAVTPTASVVLPGVIGRVVRFDVSVFDGDFADEATLLINGQGPIAMFPGADAADDSIEVTHTIPLAGLQSFFLQGNNTFQFNHALTAGCEIRGIRLGLRD